MKVLLIEDVYNLGRAGEIKKVANGYGRNYLLPQGLAVLATPQALKNVEHIKESANKRRAVLNQEMSGVAENMVDMRLEFPARAGETGKLYGSVTTIMIAEALSEKLGVEISKRQIDSQPLRLLGMHTVKVRLTIDLIPDVDIVVYREGEPVENYLVSAEELAAQSDEADGYVEAEFEAEEPEAEAEEEESAAEAVEEAEETAPEEEEAEETAEE